MVFTSSIVLLDSGEVPERQGRKKVTFGTFTNTAGSVGGDITTGLTKVDFIKLQHTGSAVVASEPTVNETFPFEGGDPTIVTTADADGIWMAVGDDH